MQKKIMILGGGQAQIGLIKKAKELGLYTIIVGIKGEYPGYDLADKIYYIDINQKDAILKIAQDEKIDGITMVCSDFGLKTVGFVCDTMGLSGLSERAADSSSNKLRMKTLLQNNNVNTAKFRIINNIDDLINIEESLSYPMIIKAVDLQGSNGIYVCKNKEELLRNYTKTISLSKERYCIVEEFIEGVEFGAQAFVYDDEILFIQPHGDIVNRVGNTNVPIGHYMPYKDDDADFKMKIYDIVSKSIRAIGLNNCAVNVDLIAKDGVPYIIELTGRAGANFLPEVTSEYLGIDYYQLIIYGALRMNPQRYYNNRTAKSEFVLSKQLFSNISGLVDDIYVSNSKKIDLCSIFIEKGQFVKKFANSSDCIGKVLCKGVDFADCENKINDFINNEISIVIKQI